MTCLLEALRATVLLFEWQIRETSPGNAPCTTGRTRFAS